MEDVRGHVNIELVSDANKFLKLVAKPQFNIRTIYTENCNDENDKFFVRFK